jgi:hypothetical protein
MLRTRTENQMRGSYLQRIFLFSLLLLPLSCNQGGGGVIILCGGAGNFQCPAGLYCELGAACGGIDHKGECRRIPPTCEPGGKEVCGCNGRTFPNVCYANASGISVAYDGACMKTSTGAIDLQDDD